MSHLPIFVQGTHITQFGELWDRSLEDLAKEATLGAVADAVIQPSTIEAIFVGNMAAGQFEGQQHLGALVSSFFSHLPPSTRVEAACASGGLAVLQAEMALLSGMYQTVLVVGVEKMTDDTNGVTTILSSAADAAREYGSTFPGLYALLAKEHMHKYQTPRRALSMIAAKNHSHALANQQAQFRRTITPDQVEKSMLVADPLRILDCSPITDGAAAVVLSVKPSRKQLVALTGFGQGQETLDLARRSSLTSLQSTVDAAKKAYAMANKKPTDIQVAEVHDCFTIAELFAMEDLGFCKRGTAATAVLKEETTLSQYRQSSQKKLKSSLPIINHSGGLKACGHPVGATGVKQVAYMTRLLRENSDFSVGLTHNVGGSGATAVVHILEKGQS